MIFRSSFKMKANSPLGKFDSAEYSAGRITRRVVLNEALAERTHSTAGGRILWLCRETGMEFQRTARLEAYKIKGEKLPTYRAS